MRDTIHQPPDKTPPAHRPQLPPPDWGAIDAWQIAQGLRPWPRLPRPHWAVIDAWEAAHGLPPWPRAA